MKAASKRNHPMELVLNLTAASSLTDELAAFGRIVGPRRGDDRRTQRQREDYCLRRWLVATAATSRLAFPATVTRPTPGTGPDYLLETGTERGCRGIEVVEAGNASWQRWLTLSEPEDTESKPRFLMDRREGYQGDEPERMVVRDIELALERKRSRFAASNYGAYGACDLLVYENSEGGVVADDEQVVKRVAGSSLKASPFAAMHLILGNTVILDALGDAPVCVDVSVQHADDWSAWLNEQARHLRERNFAALDADHLAEELESLSRSDLRALQSQFRRLISHLLKWQFQKAKRGRSWSNTIDDAREKIEELLRDNPSFEHRTLAIAQAEYLSAMGRAARETGINKSRFPIELPYSIDQLRDVDYLPESQQP